MCGGRNNKRKCLQLDHSTWTNHSSLNVARVGHSTVTTKSATFLFGGIYSRKTFEYLLNGSNIWLMGKKEIPGNGFYAGCAIAIKSEEEILLIGGLDTQDRILSFNIKDHTFRELQTRLNVGRVGNRCAFIPKTKKVMITGGCYLNSTEILDTESESIINSNPLNSKRCNHGMGILTVDGEDKLVTYGGENNGYINTVEIYNTQTEEWETTDIKLKVPRAVFGFLTVKLDTIIPGLQYCRYKKI